MSFPKRVLIFQLCFTGTVLLSVFLKQPAGCCVPAGHGVPWGWGHWDSPHWSQPAPWCTQSTDCPSCHGCAASVAASVSRPGSLLSVHSSSQERKELLQKPKLQKPKELRHFPAPAAAGPFLPWLLGVRATLPCSTAPSAWGLGGGFVQS